MSTASCLASVAARVSRCRRLSLSSAAVRRACKQVASGSTPASARCCSIWTRRGERLLLAGGLEFAVHRVQLNVGGGGVESDLLLGILEAQVSGLHSGARSFGVLALGEAENQRLHRGASDRGWPVGKPMRVADLGADDEVGDIRVLRLRQRGLCLLHIGLGELDGARVALGQVDDRAPAKPVPAKGRRQRERQSKDERRPGSARIVSGLHVHHSHQNLIPVRACNRAPAPAPLPVPACAPAASPSCFFRLASRTCAIKAGASSVFEGWPDNPRAFWPPAPDRGWTRSARRRRRRAPRPRACLACRGGHAAVDGRLHLRPALRCRR